MGVALGSCADLGSEGGLAAEAAGLRRLRSVRLEYNGIAPDAAARVRTALAHVPGDGASGHGTGLKVS